ncbi:hypothetical protein IKF15_03845 [Candidatus Saccharibacteria bacterium]|nr:hypothetical protein [Candidatus Saccharibacteria bacterium]
MDNNIYEKETVIVLGYRRIAQVRNRGALKYAEEDWFVRCKGDIYSIRVSFVRDKEEFPSGLTQNLIWRSYEYAYDDAYQQAVITVGKATKSQIEPSVYDAPLTFTGTEVLKRSASEDDIMAFFTAHFGEAGNVKEYAKKIVRCISKVSSSRYAENEQGWIKIPQKPKEVWSLFGGGFKKLEKISF